MLNMITGLGLYKLGCDVWNAFADVAVSFLLKTPQEMNGDVWRLVTESIYPIFFAIGSSMIVVFFMMGMYRDCSDLRHITSFEGAISIFMRLGIANTFLLVGLKFIKAMFSAGRALSELVMDRTGSFTGGSFGHLDAASTFFANKDETIVFAGLIVGVLFFVTCLVCGGTIAFTVIRRLYKLLFEIPTAALAIPTIAGGGGLSHSATSWGREFLGNVLEATFIIFALAITVPLMGMTLFNGSTNVESILSVIEPAFKIILVTTAVKGTEHEVRKYIGL